MIVLRMSDHGNTVNRRNALQRGGLAGDASMSGSRSFVTDEPSSTLDAKHRAETRTEPPELQHEFDVATVETRPRSGDVANSGVDESARDRVDVEMGEAQKTMTDEKHVAIGEYTIPGGESA